MRCRPAGLHIPPSDRGAGYSYLGMMSPRFQPGVSFSCPGKHGIMIPLGESLALKKKSAGFCVHPCSSLATLWLCLAFGMMLLTH